MREIAVESVFKILTSRSISELIKTLHGAISLYIQLKQTSIGIFSPAGDRLLIAGSTHEDIETASLIDVTRNFDVMELLHDRKPVLLRPFQAESRISNIQDMNEELPPGNILMPMEIDNTVLGMLILYCSGAMSSVNEEVLELVGDIAITATNAVISIHEKDSYKVEQDRLKSEVESLSGDYVATKFYREVFMNNPDGMVVMDFMGKIIRANPASEALLCQDGNPLPDYFIELVEEDQKENYNALLDGFQQGIYPRNYEVDIVLPTGRRSILAVSISLVPEREGYVLMTLRDVTQERIIERQLAEAKAFQERILNSSVDAIMAADLEGTIVLFNEAAATLTGWPAREVPGRKNVKEFYPPGQAREVMKKLKSDDYGGKGRMEPQKIWVINRKGENIPVLLSAAIIYDEGREAYTCGIFSDLREKIRSEEKIAFISERLQQSEKQAELAELAGTMAHELNQPLTSIYGCGELLMRRLSTDKSYQRYVKIILDEATKMSDIIKKIGKITRYETQNYIGKTRIIDINKSSGCEKESESGGENGGRSDDAGEE